MYIYTYTYATNKLSNNNKVHITLHYINVSNLLNKYA